MERWCCFSVILDLGLNNLGFGMKSHGYGNLRANVEKYHSMSKGIGSPSLEPSSHHLKLRIREAGGLGTQFLLYGNRFPSWIFGNWKKQMVSGNGFPKLETRFPYFALQTEAWGNRFL